MTDETQEPGMREEESQLTDESLEWTQKRLDRLSDGEKGIANDPHLWSFVLGELYLNLYEHEIDGLDTTERQKEVQFFESLLRGAPLIEAIASSLRENWAFFVHNLRNTGSLLRMYDAGKLKDKDKANVGEGRSIIDGINYRYSENKELYQQGIDTDTFEDDGLHKKLLASLEPAKKLALERAKKFEEELEQK